jgi:hypothetical protein
VRSETDAAIIATNNLLWLMLVAVFRSDWPVVVEGKAHCQIEPGKPQTHALSQRGNDTVAGGTAPARQRFQHSCTRRALAASNSPASWRHPPQVSAGAGCIARQQLQLQHAAGTDFGGRWQPSRNKASDILARWSQPAVLRTAGVIDVQVLHQSA